MSFVILSHAAGSSFIGKPVISEHASFEDAKTEANALQERTGAMTYAIFSLEGEKKEIRGSKFMRSADK